MPSASLRLGITAVTRGDGHADPETTVELAEGSAALVTPLL